MKHLVFTCLLVCSALSIFAQKNADETAIKTIIQKQEELWNKHDMVAFSQFYTDDATLINFVGMFWTSKADIISHFNAINDCCLVPTTVKFDYKFMRPIAPDVAIVYIEETIIADKAYDVPDRHYKKGETDYKLLSSIFIKKNNDWMIAASQLTLINQRYSPHVNANKN